MNDWLVWPGNPRPAPRPKFDPRTGRAYMPLDYKRHQHEIRLDMGSQINARDLDVYFGNERLAVTMFLARNGGGDGDNMSKTVTDALNEVWYQDDRQILEWHIFLQRGIPKPLCSVYANVQPVRGWPVKPPHSLDPCDFCAWRKGE